MNALRVFTGVDPADLHVKIGPLKRRHLRQVMRIEQQVYPRPWSLGVFYGELGYRDGSRCYVAARVGSTPVNTRSAFTASSAPGRSGRSLRSP